MPKPSAGLLLYRRPPHRSSAPDSSEPSPSAPGLEVFLVHPGGPFWAKKDLGAWSIPKGEHNESEAPLDAARREFTEETGFAAEGEFVALGTVRINSGKLISAWALEGDCDSSALASNFCEIEWPPRSGRRIEIPEVDRGAWFPIDEARRRIFAGQQPFLDKLVEKLKDGR